MSNNKFVGYALMFVFFIITFTIGAMGIQHPLFMFNSGGLGEYSDMNKYGHFFTRFSWLKLYWFGFVALLFVLAVLFAVRGTDTIMKTRLNLSRYRLTRPLLVSLFASVILFVGTGFFVYYNTNQLNTYRTSEEGEQESVDYEKALKKYQHVPQLRIVESNLKVEIYPTRRDFTAEGFYWLKNKTAKPIADVHIQENIQENVKTDYLKFSNGGAKVAKDWKDFGYTIYRLAQPLAPGDSVKMDFKVNFTTQGFTSGGGNTNVVNNGTFFNNTYFPSLGYAEEAELGERRPAPQVQTPRKRAHDGADRPARA